MPLYHQHKDKLIPIRENPFRLEREIQELTERNLQTVFGLELVRSEMPLHGFRIDTLAFDPESHAFVIIEYKRDKNFSVIDQGYAYLALMLNNKADFILEYNERTGRKLKRSDVDWSQSRVIFVAPSFTDYQKEAINFKDLPIELWEIKRYENHLIAYNQVRKLQARESIKTLSPKDKSDVVTREIKIYSEEDHLQRVGPEMKELYEKLKNAIMNLGDFEVRPKKLYIAFVSGTNVVDILPQKKSLKIWLNSRKGELDDPKGLARDVSQIGHWGNGDYEIIIKDDEDLEYILSLIKQVLRKREGR